MPARSNTSLEMHHGFNILYSDATSIPMGNRRSDMMDIDRVTKKKVSEDKVIKHEGKHRKPMRHIKSEDSDDESSKVGLKSPKQAHENALTLRTNPRHLRVV